MLCFLINCVDSDQHLAIRLIMQINRHYPEAEMLVIPDGDLTHDHLTKYQRLLGSDRLKICWERRVPLKRSHNGRPAKTHLFAQHNFESALRYSEADTFIHMDPDCYLNRRFQQIPDAPFAGIRLFQKTRFGPAVIMHGACWMIKRAGVQEIVKARPFKKQFFDFPRNHRNWKGRREQMENLGLGLGVGQIIDPQRWADLGHEMFLTHNGGYINLSRYAVVHPNTTDDAVPLRCCNHEPIWGIGLGRTGSHSLAEALRILGYSCSHLIDERQMFESCSAVDLVVAANYQRLYRMYPNSKFILTTRNKPAWLASWRRRVRRNALARNAPHIREHYLEMRQHFMGFTEVFNPATAIAGYNRHNAEVRKFFSDKPGQLLELSVCDNSDESNWRQLSRFLGCEMPSQPFPCVKG